jgi:hypothetical protein
MQKVTRYARKKKAAQKRIQADRRRSLRAQKREHNRKLKRKLVKIIDNIGCGYYTGVRESPLLRANFSYVMRVLNRRLKMPLV